VPAVYASTVVLLAIVGELSFTFWLMIKGVNVEEWHRRAPASA
jgi:hypothetical protein